LAAACGVAVVFLMLGALSVRAHEHREVANGQYAITIGFITEPAFVNEQNGLYLRVDNLSAAAAATAPAEEGEHADGTGVIGLQETLQAEVIFGDQRMPLALTPGTEPGVYESVFFPTAVGDYTYHLAGTIEGTAIDEAFTSSPEGFDSVQGIEEYQFPKPSAGVSAGDEAVDLGFPGVVGGLGLLIGAGGLWWGRRRHGMRAAAELR